MLTGEAEPTAPLSDSKGVSIEVKKQAALQRRRQRELQKQHHVPATTGVLSQPTSPAPQKALEGLQGGWPGVSQGVALGAAQNTSYTGVWRTSSQAPQGGARGLQGGLQGGLQAVAPEECVRLSKGTGVFAEGDDDAWACLSFLCCFARLFQCILQVNKVRFKVTLFTEKGELADNIVSYALVHVQ